MDAPLLRLAIASDLHCHGAGDLPESRRESFLIANAMRTPTGTHPVQALIGLVRDEEMVADALFCPGDMAHKASSAGLVQCWDHLRELRSELKAPALFCTVGNHDVESRGGAGDPFSSLKHCHPDFPFPDKAASAQFWANGFVLRPVTTTADVIILNTSYHHYSDKLAKAGTFTNDQVQDLDLYLRDKPAPGVRIAMMHHHPVLHSSAGFDSSDVLPNGDEILDVLAKHGCSMIVHGHRHQPRLRRHPASGKEMIVFAAGSFSAYLRTLGSQTRNLFHYLVVEGFEGSEPVGYIKSWEFNFSEGWSQTGPKSSRFPYKAYFGPAPKGSVKADIVSLMTSTTSGFADLPSLLSTNPNLARLLPEEIEALAQELPKDGLKLIRSDTGEIEGVGRILKKSAGFLLEKKQ